MILRRCTARDPDRPLWPTHGTWESDALYRELREAVLDLEDRWTRGTLKPVQVDDPELLACIGPELGNTYRNLAAKAPRGDLEFRRQTILALLEQLRDSVFRVERWCAFASVDGSHGRRAAYATWIGEQANVADPTVSEPAVVQRRDQLLARRFWGLGFLNDDVDATDALSRRSVHAGVARFACDITDVAKVLKRPARGVGSMVPDHGDRRFEQLMLDILDENNPRARPARLREDFCQKTDLRVRYPGLQRPKGARVQVKSASILAVHAERIASIRNPEQLVILSPVELARFVERQPAAGEDRALDHEALRAVWDALPDQPASTEDLSQSISRVLWNAISAPLADPRGPMGLVPAPIRDLIRTFVRERAFLSTASLRRELENGAEVSQGSDGRLRYRSGRRSEAGESAAQA